MPAKVLGDTAKSLTSGSEVTIALAPGGAGEGLIGFEGAACGGVRRTTTRLLDGEFPKVRSLFPAEHQTVATVDKAELIESVKRVALVAERNTAVQLAFGDDPLVPRRRLRRRGAGQRVDRGRHQRRRHHHRLQPAVPARRPQGHRRAGGRPRVHPGDQARCHQRFDRRRRRDEGTGFRYLLMPRRLLS